MWNNVYVYVCMRMCIRTRICICIYEIQAKRPKWMVNIVLKISLPITPWSTTLFPQSNNKKQNKWIKEVRVERIKQNNLWIWSCLQKIQAWGFHWHWVLYLKALNMIAIDFIDVNRPLKII